MPSKKERSPVGFNTLMNIHTVYDWWVRVESRNWNAAEISSRNRSLTMYEHADLVAVYPYQFYPFQDPNLYTVVPPCLSNIILVNLVFK
jgi:hypothetical protein